MLRFDDRVAIITGAGHGLGRSHALLLAERGAKVVVNDLGGSVGGEGASKDADLTVKIIESRGGVAVANYEDVADHEGAGRMVAQAVDTWGQLDILVNNAGILLDDAGKKVSEQTRQAWRDTFDTNVFGLIETTQAFLPLLHKSPAGRIVNVSSLLGSLAQHSDPSSPIYDFKVPAYNVSKSAVNAWTVQLAYELKDSRIKVNTIHPGYVKTDLNGGGGEIEVADGARTSVAMALIDDAGPNGSYRYLDKVIPW